MGNLLYNMYGTLKRKGLIWSAIFSLTAIFTSCHEASSVKERPSVKEMFKIVGRTQGTTYSVIIVDEKVKLTKEELDTVLRKFDLSLSTYIKESVISRMNANSGKFIVTDPTGFFKMCYSESQHIYKTTKGLFDPSVYPLVEGWGFMNDMETPLNQKEVDSLLQFVSFEERKHHELVFSHDDINVSKRIPEFKMDFNAIAQGLSVDVLYDYIENKGYENFYVEIGGELRVKGTNKHGTSWNIGVDSPIENTLSRPRDTIIHISDKAIATSGNYRKFYVKDGIKYSHTLNPETGKPVKHSLLSATVIADKCSTADGYATAFMVLGTDDALLFVEEHPEENLEVYLLYAGEDGEIKHAMSDGFSIYLK